MGLQERWVLTVLVAPVPCPIHCAIGKDPQEVAPVATVEEFGLLVIPRRQIELLRQGREGCDFPFSHGSVAAARVCSQGCKKLDNPVECPTSKGVASLSEMGRRALGPGAPAWVANHNVPRRCPQQMGQCGGQRLRKKGRWHGRDPQDMSNFPIGHHFGPSYAFFRTSNLIIWPREGKKNNVLVPPSDPHTSSN